MPRRPSVSQLLLLAFISIVLVFSSLEDTARAQSQSAANGYDAQFFKALRWRNIGPIRGGRSIASAGSARPPE